MAKLFVCYFFFFFFVAFAVIMALVATIDAVCFAFAMLMWASRATMTGVAFGV